ncbi:MAG: hypothetical protein V1899_07190 [Planctomycetota bacterium]
MKLFLTVLLAGLLVAPALFAADDNDLNKQLALDMIKKLASKKKVDRTTAITALLQLGEAGEQALNAAKTSENLEPRQYLLLRRLLGEFLVAKTPLQPVVLSTLTPLGEEKEKNVAGNPLLLLNRQSKTIVMDGWFYQENGPLEYLVCSRVPNATKLHETILAISSLPRDVCMALLVCEYTYAGELTEEGQINLPKEAGVMISVEFLWEPPHADMEVQLDIETMIWAMQAKHEAAANATPQDRTLLLWDLESDVNQIQSLIAQPMEEDKAMRKLFLETLRKKLENPRLVYNDNARETLIADLVAYLKLQNNDIAPKPKTPVTLPQKKLVRVPLEFCAWNTSTDQTMRRVPFAFTGSRYEKDSRTKRPIFIADLEGLLVACKLDQYAVLNTLLDMRNVDPQHDAGYVINNEIVPRRFTKCRLVFEPWSGGELTTAQLKDIGEKKSSGVAPIQNAK